MSGGDKVKLDESLGEEIGKEMEERKDGIEGLKNCWEGWVGEEMEDRKGGEEGLESKFSEGMKEEGDGGGE